MVALLGSGRAGLESGQDSLTQGCSLEQGVASVVSLTSPCARPTHGHTSWGGRAQVYEQQCRIVLPACTVRQHARFMRAHRVISTCSKGQQGKQKGEQGC